MPLGRVLLVSLVSFLTVSCKYSVQVLPSCGSGPLATTGACSYELGECLTLTIPAQEYSLGVPYFALEFELANACPYDLAVDFGTLRAEGDNRVVGVDGLPNPVQSPEDAALLGVFEWKLQSEFVEAVEAGSGIGIHGHTLRRRYSGAKFTVEFVPRVEPQQGIGGETVSLVFADVPL